MSQIGLVAGSILSPLLATITITATGFGAGGILAGSSAAALMSSYGGNVTAGSLCAILQSIGASGMSSGLSACLGVLGGGIGSTLLISNPVSEGDNENVKNDREAIDLSEGDNEIDREAIEFIRYIYK